MSQLSGTRTAYTNSRPTNPKRGHRLGTLLATWNKIKAATIDSGDGSHAEEVIDDGEARTDKHSTLEVGNGSAKDALENGLSDTKKAGVKPEFVEIGPRGEVYIYYQDLFVLELWDWNCTQRDTLTFIRSVQFQEPGITAFKVGEIHGTSAMVTTSNDSLIIHTSDRTSSSVKLPKFFASPFTIKISKSVICVASADGYVALYSVEKPRLELIPVRLRSLFQTITRPLADNNCLRIDEDAVILKTSTTDKMPVFDLQGSWLAYCPTKHEMDHQKHLLHSDSATLKKKSSNRKCLFTDVKLPPQGPLLMRVVSSISGSALDKLFALSESGTKTFREYWLKPKSEKQNIIDKDVSLHSISSNISQALYSTASKIKKLALDSGDHRYIRVINLDNGQMIATFKPPAGVSQLSLSPYDLQLVHASFKGDSFYLWDLYKLPNEASLVGKFTRGNTSATVKEIMWFVNTDDQSSPAGTNSGFGCISKKKGSLHWYNINYLSCGNEADNYPNRLGGKSNKNMLGNGQFLDSWVLPSIGAAKFMKLPRAANVPTSSAEDKLSANWLYKSNQLAFLDNRGNIRLVSPLNGKHTFKYVLPKESTTADSSSSFSSFLSPSRLRLMPTNEKDYDTPLAQTEIETCNKYLSVINDKRFELSIFDIEDEEDVFDYLREIEPQIPSKTVDFGGVTTNPLQYEETEKNLIPDLDTGLLIDPETSAEET
uniref:Uncharacterized protein n=1 Tax=Candidozyma auris TaxID=498019 RepID=A0A0L0NTW5_CANAR